MNIPASMTRRPEAAAPSAGAIPREAVAPRQETAEATQRTAPPPGSFGLARPASSHEDPGHDAYARTPPSALRRSDTAPPVAAEPPAPATAQTTRLALRERLLRPSIPR